jgi:tRNA (guanine-N7-)-methyltransferase
MTRKSFAIRHLKAIPPDEEAARKYFLHWHSGDLYRSPEAFPRISSRALFGNDRPLELEVGSGTGEFLCSLAANDLTANYVGIDISLKSVYASVHRASALGLDNVKFVKGAIQYVYPLFVPESLRAIYLHFPDPCLRPKYRGKRVFNPRFLDAAYLALEEGGHISVMTDVPELFDIMASILRQDPRFVMVEGPDPAAAPAPSAVKSRYQSVWERQGTQPLRFLARKTEGRR